MVTPSPIHPDVLHFAVGLTYPGAGDGHMVNKVKGRSRVHELFTPEVQADMAKKG
jgi:hypothetical protein